MFVLFSNARTSSSLTSESFPFYLSHSQELILYLLQLVQALKFDSFSPSLSSTNNSTERGNDRKGNGLNNFSPTSSIINSNTAASSPSNSSNLNNSNGESGLTDFLIRRSLKNPVLGNNLYWYLVVECEDKTYGKMYRKVKARFWEKMGEVSRVRFYLSAFDLAFEQCES